MAVNTIDAQLLQKMFLAGARRIESKKEWINELNVFPVPDGDTGTNMSMTIMAAAREVEQIADPNMENLSKAISMGALRGARGNSGVILSQLFRGFTKEIKEVAEIDLTTLAAAMCKATETAYKAVMKPKEGTILTVARGLSDKAMEIALETEDMAEAMEAIVLEGDRVLDSTPELLPVLKQAGVVDSGGQGLMQVIKGAVDCFLGKEEIVIEYTKTASGEQRVSVEEIDTADIKFGYCTEFIVMLEKPFDDDTELEFKAFLESIGDSIVCVHLEDIVKVHVHTNDPGLAIQKGLSYGSLTSMKIDNMREEHHEKVIKDAQKMAQIQAENDARKKAERDAAAQSGQVSDEVNSEGPSASDSADDEPREAGFIAVSIGDGLNTIFNELGVDYVIEGGQTMNPSTDDMLKAIDAVNAKTVYILPNNKNIILAANQAQSLVEDKTVVVIPSKTIPQGIAALLGFMEGASAQDNLDEMIQSMQAVKSGQLTYAVRDTEIGDKVIKSGDIMGISDNGIDAVGQNVDDTAIALLEKLVDEDSELISIYSGCDVSSDDAEALCEKIQERFEGCEVEFQYGGQPVYYYVMSVE